MVLAQWCREKRYLEFYQSRVEAGDLVILDNGAYEEVPVSWCELSRWAKELQPSVVVLPDVPGNMVETIIRSDRYLQKYGVPKEAMMVLHAKDGRYHAFAEMYAGCYTKWVGFSRLTRCYDFGITDPWKAQRSTFAWILQKMKTWRPELKHHALGMLGGDLSDVKELAQLGFTSVDSSAPIWRGLHGFKLNDFAWPNYEFDPRATEFAGLQQAERNLSEVMEACGYGRAEK